MGCMVRALYRLAPYGLPVVSVLFLVSGPVFGAVPDQEEYRNAIIAVTLHARALLDGVYPYWTSALGFGLPHPLHPAFLLHPFVPLFALLEPDAVVRLVYIAHAALGAAGCWMLVRHFRVGAWVAGLAASTWALSAPSQNYALTDLWPTEFITWSLAPYLLLLALRVLDAPGGRRWIDAVGFGLVAGLIAGNGHTGHVPVFFVSLAVMCAADARLVARRLPELVLATSIGAAIAAPTLTHLLSEVGRFPELGRLTGDVALGWSALLDAVLRPLSLTSPGELLTVGGERGTRVPFFGGPMLLLAFAYVVQLVRTEPYRRSLVLAFVSAFAFTLAPSVGGAAALSAMFLFRDPMILFGIVMACVALQATASRRPRTATAIGALQLAVLFAAAWPFVTEARSSRGLSDTFLQHSATTTALQGWTERLPGRWYIAPQLDEAIRRGYLTGVGLSPEVWTYRGLPVVNGTFKGVSQTRFTRVPHSRLA